MPPRRMSEGNDASDSICRREFTGLPRVKPEILRWARETADLTLEEAAKKIALNPARGVAGADRLLSMESENEDREIPTRALLVRMAKQYRRPLLTFYLSEPPRVADRGRDFRLLRGVEPPDDNVLLDVLIRNVRARQEMVRSILEDEDEADRLPFVGSKRLSDGVNSVVASLERTLALTAAQLHNSATKDEAFSLLRGRVEGAGVFVLLIGDLGSHHSRIAPETFRGYAIADEVAPFVVINDQDSRAAWPFTLLHELAHIWLGETGVSGPVVGVGVEQFCNDVASQFMLPEDLLRRMDFNAGPTLALAITEFANQRNLSRSMVAYRLFRSGRIDEGQWQALSEKFRQEWLDSQERQRARGKEKEGGPNYYVVKGHRVGKALPELVRRMISSGALTTAKAGLVLDVKPTQVPAMLRATRRSTSRYAV